jgi:APA family basic amino acid/polyamine antiporter
MNQTTAVQQPAVRSLPRVLGLWDVLGILIGSVIGSGIFIVPAEIAGLVKAPLIIMSVWVVGGALSFFGALCFAELGAMYPEAGGMYVFLREAYGRLIAFLFGWTLFLVIDTGAIATLSMAFSSKYLPYFVPMSPVAIKVVALVFVVVLVAVNYLGVRYGAGLQNLLMFIKFGAIFAVTGVVFLFAHGNTANFTTPAITEVASAGLVGAFGLALVRSLWAYKGWEMTTFTAGELKNPGRNLPLGLFAGTLVVIALYLATNLAYLYVFPASEIAGKSRVAADAIQLIVGPIGGSIIAVVILLSITGAANGNVLTAPRVIFAMAKDGLFFKQLASVHPMRQTPHVAILVVGLWAAILSLTGTFEQLATYVIFGQWIFFGLTAGAVIVLRKKRPDVARPYRTPGYPVTPIVFIGAALFISVNTLILQPINALAGLGIIVLGVPAFLYWRKKA